MFTGIVEALCTVREVRDARNIRNIVVEVPETAATAVSEGDSVSINGVCLTIVSLQGCLLRFDVIRETLNRSNISMLNLGDEVNVERSLRYGDQIGGHLLSGHVWSCIPCTRLEQQGDNIDAWFSMAPDSRPYILPKGFVALDGASLTVARVERERQPAEFAVSLIPETRHRTRFGGIYTGMMVNLEIDSRTQAIVDTVKQVMAEQHFGRPSLNTGESA